MKALDQQIELTRLNDSEANRQWRAGLEKEREQAEYDRQERDKKIRKEFDLVREARLHGREEQWQDILHEQQMDRMQGEIALERSERQAKLERAKAEVRQIQMDQMLTFKRRRAEVRKRSIGGPGKRSRRN